jgi:hypothetical protein
METMRVYVYEGQSKSSRNFFLIGGLVPLGLSVLVISASFAEEAAEPVTGRDSAFCFTMTHRATRRLLCHHPTAVLSGYRSQ